MGVFFFLAMLSNCGRTCFTACAYRVNYFVPDFFSGVLVCGVSLVSEMCRVNPETLSHFRRVSEWLADVFAFLMYHSTVLLLSSVYSK